MDKYEYKVRLGEIDTLIIDKDFEEAAIIADSIDWKRVKSVKTLCMISDVYKYVNRLEDAEELLSLAYERHPSSKSVVFALCELCIKLDQYVPALEYYKEYVQLAPDDYGRYVLQYKLYVAQDVSLEERIEVLLELKKHTPIPKWQYELAYLYHRIGDSAKCIEECDEIILWYGEGKYVTKAMELKMQHSPLTPTQQAKYDTKDITGTLFPAEEKPYTTVIPNVEADTIPAAQQTTEDDHVANLQVKTDVGEYNTINLQKELADSMKDMWEVTPDNLIRPVSTSLHPGDVKPVGGNDTEDYPDAYTEAGFVEDDPMATKVLKEIREENNADAVEEVFFNDDNKNNGFGDDNFDHILGMEYDGQMSMVVPEQTVDDDTQITGQLRIEDILAEWEQKKKDNEKQLEEEVRQRVLEHTGNILVDFDFAVRDGLLEKLEKEPIDENADYSNLPDYDEDEEYQGEEEYTEEENPETEYTEEEYPEEEYAEDENFEDDFEDAEPVEEVEAVEEDTETVEDATGEMTFEEDLETEEPEVIPEDEATEEENLEEVEEKAEEEDVPEAVEEEAKEEPSETVEEKADETSETAEEAVEDKAEKEEEAESTGNAEVVAAEAAAEAEDNSPSPRELSKEEKELYASYIQNKKIQGQLVNAVDSVSLAPYAGNLIITGEEGMDPTTLAKNIMKEIQLIDSNFSGKIAKISGNSLNAREPSEIIGKISNGALIIENAGRMTPETADQLYKSLQNEDAGIIIVMAGTKKSIAKLMDAAPKLKECFAAQIDLEALDNDTLVRFGKEYALSQEYSIDEMGLLALHTRISDHQTSDHAVTMIEVKKMISDAIRNANRKNIGHFFDVLFGKRYDNEDMIILKEKDFA